MPSQDKKFNVLLVVEEFRFFGAEGTAVIGNPMGVLSLPAVRESLLNLTQRLRV
jgi:hypothetical protein